MFVESIHSYKRFSKVSLNKGGTLCNEYKQISFTCVYIYILKVLRKQKCMRITYIHSLTCYSIAPKSNTTRERERFN
jgi:hypothetical protein